MKASLWSQISRDSDDVTSLSAARRPYEDFHPTIALGQIDYGPTKNLIDLVPFDKTFVGVALNSEVGRGIRRFKH